MARPKKLPDEKRYKWAVLNVTPTERAAIERAAGEAGQGVNAFILSCVRTARPVQMGHWRQMVQELLASAQPSAEQKEVKLLDDIANLT